MVSNILILAFIDVFVYIMLRPSYVSCYILYLFLCLLLSKFIISSASVLYCTAGVPLHLRQEFIYRNPSNLHVSEFHALIVKVTEGLVAEGISVRMSSLSTPTEADLNSNDVVIFITSVKPIHVPRSSAASPHAVNQVREFQHFVPFTMNPKKAHAKTMDQQWKRSLLFTVMDYFPYISIRQTVFTKTSTDISPIEVAIDDINDRVGAMSEELENARAADTNNLMRLIQGTVLPQVRILYNRRICRFFLIVSVNRSI